MRKVVSPESVPLILPDDKNSYPEYAGRIFGVIAYGPVKTASFVPQELFVEI